MIRSMRVLERAYTQCDIYACICAFHRNKSACRCGQCVRAVLQDKLCYHDEDRLGQVFSYHRNRCCCCCALFVLKIFSGDWHDGIEGLVHAQGHVHLDRGSVHVCHNVSVARIGFQHKATRKHAPRERTVRMAIV